MGQANEFLNELQQHPVWDGLPLQRLIPLLEAVESRRFEPGALLAEQFHPALALHLLCRGTVSHAGMSETRTDTIAFGPVDWHFGAIGWSGFLAPQRYGTTVRAETEVETLCWSHAALAQCFYADPVLSLPFFDLILDSVHQQLTDLRSRRLASSGVRVAPPSAGSEVRPGVLGLAENCLRRSAFFRAFDDVALAALAADAEPVFFQPGERIVDQDEVIDGLLLLASGRCNASFVDADGRLLPFRRLHHQIGVIAALPLPGSRFAAEACVTAETGCWVYRLPAQSIAALKLRDPETGRSFQQRLLTRMAALIASVRVVQGESTPEPEVSAIANIIANNQTRLPVTSDLHKVPHLLRNRLTVANAFAVLKSVASAGGYPERQLAGQCNDLLTNIAAEHAFYHGIMQTCEAVISADEAEPATRVRSRCDAMAADAFAHLDCRVHGEAKLPASGGNIFVMNHLACPVYYELPNYYHFSFDTAFASCIIWRHFDRSAIRVVRESPGAEFAHNLFYRRLQPISVPTLESGVDDLDAEALAALRRAAGERFTAAGCELLAAGENLLICPEGQSQPPERSPARFHTGAFRLALAAGAPVIPLALGGFQRRYKDGPLVVIVGEPVDVAASMQSNGYQDVRAFADALRQQMAGSVQQAMEEAAGPAALHYPD